MTSDIVQRLEEHAQRMEQHEQRITAVEDGHDNLRSKMEVLQNDVTGIKAALGQTATKSDVEAAKGAILQKLHEAVTGLLGDALNAVPAKQMTVWTIVLGVAALGSLIVSVIEISLHK